MTVVLRPEYKNDARNRISSSDEAMRAEYNVDAGDRHRVEKTVLRIRMSLAILYIYISISESRISETSNNPEVVKRHEKQKER